ncbi:hypothetical protein EMA8858_00678 [Emticicia aquatica]|uniref:FecR family protein n=1 Tax=Emticicia aquatica TaxID=1681835 RepID=A0ABN8ES17_9BACT|nr:FecR family protein [Emticicia aquatica]CAH0994568.1 hypothetical protein EMA8858_00678 [Emticicia aquatica]
MNRNQPINDDLLGKFLAQETDAHESALVENWLKQNEANQKELDDYRFIWQQVSSLKEEKTVNVDAAWNKIKPKINSSKEAKTATFIPKKSKFFTPTSIAAGITLLIGMGILAILLNQKNVETISLKTQNNTLEKTLPDGSVVFLNANTSLNYSTDFQQDTRNVNLIGEAFFKVQHNDKKPFIIQANGSDIKVLGTSFNVRAYDKNVKVSVETGKVQFKNKTQQTLLIKGEEAQFEAKMDTIRKITMVDKNVFSYKTKIFTFENSSLEHVINILEESYHTKIILKNNHIKSCRLTTTFNNETLPNALNIIAETLNLKVSETAGKYIIDGAGCEE